MIVACKGRAGDGLPLIALLAPRHESEERTKPLASMRCRPAQVMFHAVHTGADLSDKQRVLIVDDEDYIRELLSRWFIDEGHEVGVAASAEGVIDSMKLDPYQLLILDVSLPGMTGIELLEKIKTENGDEVAAVMVTGIDDRKTAVRCLELGAHSYVVKPIDQKDLSLNVAAALKSREQALIARDDQRFLEDEVRRRTEETRKREEEIALRLVAAAEQIARSHHEWWDGTGYPDGLSGESVPRTARVVAVADVYDALTHVRPYRPAFSEQEALEVMGKVRGKQFDPVVFDAFIGSLPVFRRIAEGITDEAA
jgi:response regulator RpfG family c-di-GMP phosphodiesterase